MYQPQTFLSPKHAVLLDSETHDKVMYLNPDSMVYLVKGIFIKLCAYGQSTNIAGKVAKNSTKPQLRKQFAREFNSVELVSDALLFTSNVDTKYRLRTPLMSLVDFKGFRAIAVALLPIRPEQGISLGFDGDGKLQEIDYSLRTELEDVGSILNLAELQTRMAKKFLSQTKQEIYYQVEQNKGGEEV